MGAIMGTPDFRCGTCRHFSRTKPKREYKNGMRYYGWCNKLEHLCHANETACKLLAQPILLDKITVARRVVAKDIKRSEPRWEIERVPTLGRTVHWWLVSVDDRGCRTYIKRFKTRKAAQAVIDRW